MRQYNNLDVQSGDPIDVLEPDAVAVSVDETSIRTLANKLIASINSGNVDAIMNNYLPGNDLAVFDIVAREQNLLDAEAYRKAWIDFYTHFKGNPKMTIIDLRITVGGNLGFSHNFIRITGTDAQGHPVDRMVRVTNGYRKVGGKWLIALEHISVPVDLATGKLVPISMS
jgi:ketosteroid isomerase-like protein